MIAKVVVVDSADPLEDNIEHPQMARMSGTLPGFRDAARLEMETPGTWEIHHRLEHCLSRQNRKGIPKIC